VSNTIHQYFIEELDLKYVIWFGEVSCIPSTDIIHSNR